jgi:hypothetical protein
MENMEKIELDPRCPYCSGTADPTLSVTSHFLRAASAERRDDGVHLDFGVGCGCGRNPWDVGLAATYCHHHACLTLSCRRCNTWAATLAIREA